MLGPTSSSHFLVHWADPTTSITSVVYGRAIWKHKQMYIFTPLYMYFSPKLYLIQHILLMIGQLYLKLLAWGSSVNIELNPELELVVTVDVRPFRVDDGVEQDGSFWNKSYMITIVYDFYTKIFDFRQDCWNYFIHSLYSPPFCPLKSCEWYLNITGNKIQSITFYMVFKSNDYL